MSYVYILKINESDIPIVVEISAVNGPLREADRFSLYKLKN